MSVTIQVEGITVTHPARYSCSSIFFDGTTEALWSDSSEEVMTKFADMNTRKDVKLIIAFDFVAVEDMALGGNG
jgi:hypothetical protein